MLSPINNYFLQQDEPVKSCLQFLRSLILALDENITVTYKKTAPLYKRGHTNISNTKLGVNTAAIIVAKVQEY